MLWLQFCLFYIVSRLCQYQSDVVTNSHVSCPSLQLTTVRALSLASVLSAWVVMSERENICSRRCQYHKVNILYLIYVSVQRDKWINTKTTKLHKNCISRRNNRRILYGLGRITVNSGCSCCWFTVYRVLRKQMRIVFRNSEK